MKTRNEQVEVQTALEELFAKNQLMPKMKSIFEDNEDVDFDEIFDELGLKRSFGYSLLIQMSLHKRCDIETLVGVLRKHYETIEEVLIGIEVCVEAELVSFDAIKEIFIVVIDIGADTQKELDLYQYPVPMVVKPKFIKTNDTYGYLTFNGSVILKDNHHDCDVNLNHINRMNSMALVINRETSSMVNNKWKGLDRRKDDETHQDYTKRLRAFDKYTRDAHFVIDLIQESKFYLTHRYDKRGRTYCQGYHINYQGTDWNKAIIEFADTKLIPLD